MERLRWKGAVILLVLITSRFDLVRNEDSHPLLPTVTVRGFLNFRTTVDNTVIVFTSASETAPPSSKAIQQTKPVDPREGSEIQELTYTQPPPEKNDVGLYKPGAELGNDGRANKNSISHISDNVVVPSSSSVFSRRTEQLSQISQPQYPTGLVTVLGASRVDGDTTTVYETRVIGTYIDGKYAQILQSTSKIVGAQYSEDGRSSKIEDIRSSKVEGTSKISKIETSRVSKIESSSVTKSIIPSVTTTSKLSTSSRPTSSVLTIESTSTSSTKLATHQSSQSTYLQSSFVSSEQPTQRQTQTLESVRIKTTTYSRSTFSQPPDEDNKVQTSQPPPRRTSTSTTTTTSRYRFVHPRRETQTVRLNRFKVRLSLRQDTTDQYVATTESDVLDEESEEQHQEEEENVAATAHPPVDPSRVVYQLTTLTSQVTLHVGRRKSVRTLTITTTVQRILDSTDSIPDSTLVEPPPPAIETPPLILSRTYSTTERSWHTSVVPVFDGLTTTLHTVTESFHILKIITAYKTLPPGDVTLLDSELTEEADSTIDSSLGHTSLPSMSSSATTALQSQLAETPAPQHGPSSDSSSRVIPAEYSNPLLSLEAALSQNPLAAVYLGLQQFNRHHANMYSTVTKTSSYVTTDTIFSTKTVRYYDGRSTKFRKISEAVSTTERTIVTTTTTLEPYLNTQVAYQQQQQLQQLIATQLPLVQPPQYSTITSPYTTMTTATDYSTRVYTLIYNAISTKYRTVTSTSLRPTMVTLYSTKEVLISTTFPSMMYQYSTSTTAA